VLSLQAGAKEEAAKPAFSANVSGHQIEVHIRYGELDPKKRKVELREAKHDSGETYQQWTLQGKPVLGTDNTDPTPGFGDGKPFDIIESITIVWDGKKRQVPQDLFDHIVLPHRRTNLNEGWAGMFFIVDPDGDAIILDMGIGDGGGSTGITWLFTRDGTHKILERDIYERGP
jgi:hypothetical protein